MTTFDETRHARDTAGRFAEMAGTEQEDGLAPSTAAVEAVCSECAEPVASDDVHAGYGMCGSCVHDALRSGWSPEEGDDR